MKTKFFVTFEMLSDWHVGTGAGISGSVDALIARDSDGFPCLPAKTVVGIWRDALETLTLGLDNDDEDKKNWQNWVDVIFGSQPNVEKNPNKTPRPAILSIQPARINENLRNAIGSLSDIDRTKYKQALTFIKPNTKIDSDTRTAQSESLRFTETGRIGSLLTANGELDFEDFNDDAKELVKALLTASAGLVERIGGNRRRGSGKCAMSVLDENKKIFDLAAAAKTIEENNDKAKSQVDEILKPKDESDVSKVSENDDAEQLENESTETKSQDEWKRVEYSLQLLTPVAIVTATLGNVSETLDFIPGTYFLPHITKVLGKGISKHIASGDFQVLPATIEIKIPKRNDKGEIEKDPEDKILLEEKRGLPVPKLIYYHKIAGGFDEGIEGGFDKNQNGKFPTVYNKITELKKIEDLTYQKKNYREGFISSLDEVKDENGNKLLPLHNTTKKILLMHNTVDDPVQRPTSDVGGVFSRQAIQAGQVLRGEIRLKKTVFDELTKHNEKWLENLKSYVRLGTSKKDDYGYAAFEILGEIGSTPPELNGNQLVVYFASDVLLRNDYLRQTNLVEDLREKLQNELSVTLKCCKKTSLIQVRRIESWHEGWGFPRPTLTAMAAGSVAVFAIENFDEIQKDETKKSEFQTKLKNLELSGIGERRGEGYGQIRFNPQILTAEINKWKVSSKVEKPKPDESERNKAVENLKSQIQSAETFKKFVENLEIAAWREEIARAVLKIANEPKKRKDIFGFVGDIPSMSQIGGLRSAIGKVNLDSTNKNVVTDWLKHLQATSNRQEKWKHGFGKIEALFTNKNEVWTILEGKGEDGKPLYFKPPNLLIFDENSLKNKLWAEAVKSFFDACARAHKRAMEDND